MGHERVGALPRSVCWRRIVQTMADLPASPSFDVSSLAANTLRNVRSRIQRLHSDSGVQAAFGYLISLATAHLPPITGVTSATPDLPANPSPARIALELREWVNQHAGSREYSELAVRAAADTIAEWNRSQSKQQSLFGDASSAADIWASASTPSGFCELARSFFSHFTERHLRYFLEREASSVIPSVEDRDRFTHNLHEHVTKISRHAFETAKITQSFAAGWFTKHATTARPTDSEVAGFLAVAFGKLHEELLREAAE